MARRASRPRLYPKPTQHVNDQGKPDSGTRGKKPHKGGYHGKQKGVNPFKIYFEISTGEIGKTVRASSSWNPGRKKRK